MSKLVMPHGSDRVRPLLLPAAERAAARRARRDPAPGPAVEPRGLGSVHARHGRLYAARGVHGRSRLARRLPRHGAGRRPVLADPDHALGGTGPGRWHSRGHGGGAGRWREWGGSRNHHGQREVRDRQGARVRPGLPHHRYRPSRRAQGHGTGPGQLGRPGRGAVRGSFSRDLQGSLPPPGRDPRPVRGTGLDAGRGVPDPQSHAPQPRISRQGGHRDLRRYSGPPGAGRAEAGRYSGRCEGRGHRCAGRGTISCRGR